jgi:hypothetical protein
MDYNMFNRKLIRDLEQKIRLLQAQVDEYKTANEKWTKYFEDIQHKCTSATPSIDFKSLNAFSIERMLREGVPTTIVGYHPVGEDSKKVEEWYLFCDDAGHEKLVKQFNEARGL